MDFLEPRRDRIRKVGAAIVDGFSNSGDVPFYRRGGLCCAFGQRRREVGEAALDRADRMSGTIGQRRGEGAEFGCRSFP